MARNFTEKELIQRAETRSSIIKERKITSFSRGATSTAKFDIFLSHSNVDRKAVEGLYDLFQEAGHSVYVYWIVDPELDKEAVTRRSVQVIQNRMRQSKALIYAFSKGASHSKWMNWELGFVDGLEKNCFRIQIEKPAASASRGLDFLQVYPWIEYDEFKKPGYRWLVADGVKNWPLTSKLQEH